MTEYATSRTITFKIKLAVAALLIAGFGSLGATLATASQASAATQQNCYNDTGATAGAWAYNRGYNFAPGTLCISVANRATIGNNHYRLVWQTDGNLVAYLSATSNNSKYAMWASKTNGRGHTLSFRTNGDLVIYDVNNIAIWNNHASANRANSTSSYRLTFYHYYGESVNSIWLQESDNIGNAMWNNHVRI